MMRPVAREDTLPWYRQFWPWFLILLPASVVVAGLSTVYIANRHADDLVVDDYYKEGLAIHKDANSTARAKSLGIAAGVDYDTGTGAVTIRLDKPPPAGTGLVTLKVTHPTLPNRDQSVQLTPLDPASYAGRLDPLGPARWKLQLYPDDKSWRIEGRLALPDNPSTRLD